MKRRLFPCLMAASITAAMPFTLALADDDDDEEIPFDEAFIFFELNDTDGDLGIHSKIDGDEWKKLEIEDPLGRNLLNINVRGTLRQQGLTELFFESAEPTFDDLDPATFFSRFPEGTYEVEGVTLDDDELESEVTVTHLIPAPPQVSVNGVPAVQDCDEDELPVFDGDVVLTWLPVTMSHPELGRTNQPIEVVNYEVVVEINRTPWKSSTILPPDATSFELPDEILELAEEGEVKYEVLVREQNYSQTAIESCFAVPE